MPGNQETRKRKHSEEEVEEAANAVTETTTKDSKEHESDDLVQVDFDFFSPASIDFHGLKSLLSQTYNFLPDLNVSDFADLIINNNELGTTVKCDGEGSDPYALLTCLGMANGDVCKVLKPFVSGMMSRLGKKGGKFHDKLKELLDSDKLGLLINERLINMPPQIAPPMYKMLLEEMEGAESMKNIDYVLYLARVYKEVEAQVDDDEQEGGEEDAEPKKKKAKKQKQKQPNADIFYFQSDDELLAQKAELVFDFKPPSTQVTDSRRVFYDFGIDPARRLMLVRKDALKAFSAQVENFVGSV